MEWFILVYIGLMLVFIGFILLIIGFLQGGSGGRGRIEGGGVVLIGPFPIVFASNAKIAIVLIILTIALMVIVYLLFYSKLSYLG